jgi:hypothetical protein
MRGFTLVVLVGLVMAGLSAAAPAATKPLHEKSSFSGEFVFAAGEVCDFPYLQEFSVDLNTLIFGDPENPTRVIDHQTQRVSHTNLSTGFALHEVDHVTFTFDAHDATFKQVGVFWHLRDPMGKMVVVQAGQLLFDTETGELLKFTPHLNPDFAAVICPALGGNPVF